MGRMPIFSRVTPPNLLFSSLNARVGKYRPETKYKCVTPLVIIMVHLVRKLKKGHVYLYLAERARVGGKSKQVWQRYLGPEERIKESPALATREKVKTQTIEFGLVAALLQVAHRLDLVDIINRSAGQRCQGLSVGAN